MDKDSIDVSIGLAFTLELLKRRRISGTLRAKLPRVSSLPRDGMAFLQIIDGIVIICQVEDKHGQVRPIPAATLTKLDTDKGPFEWVFQNTPSVPPPSQASPVTPQYIPVPPQPPLRPEHTFSPAIIHTPQPGYLTDTAIPRAIAPLRWEKLQHLTYQNKIKLYNVWKAIDGRKSIDEIKFLLREQVSSNAINEIFRVLLSLQVIVIVEM